MSIFEKLVDSYNNKNYTEFEELCKSSLNMESKKFFELLDSLETNQEVDEAFLLMMEAHPEWAEN